MGILVFFASLVFHSALPVPGSCAQIQKAPSARPAFQNKFIGEGGGGGYTQLPPDASDAIETGAHQSGSLYPGSVPQVVERPGLHPVPVSAPPVKPSQPPALHPALIRPRPAAPRPQAQAPESAPAATQEVDRERYSLWEGLAAPMELPPQKIGGVSADQAAALGRRDYDAHILGQRDAAGGIGSSAGAVRTDVLTDGAGAPGPERDQNAVLAGAWSERPGAPAAAGAAPEVFVTLNLDLKNHPDATLKDAVADLGRLAGFRQDSRFEPAAVGAGPDQVALWGWMPPERVGAAMGVAAVSRLELNPSPRRLAAETTTDMLMGVRVPRDSSPAEAVAGLESRLAAPGLRVRRTIGTQTVPGTTETVLVVEASVPITVLRRLLAHPDVVKMVPAPRSPAAAPRSRRPAAAELRRFLRFAAGQSPLLLVLTLLMLLPWVGSGAAAASRVFVPYK
ncbi:MAG: hypothetical protein HY926_04295 [Elusimicrobia bacterium]|nr:hypothetical protein [Elusimicrobiota bacterium]